MKMNKLIGKWNRLVSDVRCAVGMFFIKVGSYVTDASDISLNYGEVKWRKRPLKHDIN
jgi:hypothetical protein